MAELGGLIVHLCVDACISLYEAENGRETCSRNSDHKVIFVKICVWSSDSS